MTACSRIWSSRSGAGTVPWTTAAKFAHCAAYDAVYAFSLPVAPVGVTFTEVPLSSLNTAKGDSVVDPWAPFAPSQSGSPPPT